MSAVDTRAGQAVERVLEEMASVSWEEREDIMSESLNGELA